MNSERNQFSVSDAQRADLTVRNPVILECKLCHIIWTQTHSGLNLDNRLSQLKRVSRKRAGKKGRISSSI